MTYTNRKKDENIGTGSQSRFIYFFFFSQDLKDLNFPYDSVLTQHIEDASFVQGTRKSVKKRCHLQSQQKKDIKFLKTLQFFQNITRYLGHDLIKKRKKYSPSKLTVSKFSLQSF